ncbi:ribosome small subunit-dependent GTPase A [Halobacillus mangrovi]|uniref:ribosome small subunit-dependent GTPase A n=1 Tax=Halobacillus mangrovi TaxID=402384 RepID=UPI003D97C038
MNQLERKDFHSFFQEQVKGEEHIARVTRFSHGIYTLADDTQTYKANLSGRYHYEIVTSRDYPAVGDWVVFQPYENGEKAVIHHLLQRQTLLSRKQAGTSKHEQVIAANVDKVFIVTALTQEFNVRRLERYIQQVYESGAIPIVVCTKRDLCEDVENKIALAKLSAPGVPVHAIDNLNGEGVERLLEEVKPGETISLIGSSGVGKSTLINRMLNDDVQKTNRVRESDDRGRHTTTHRELFSLSNDIFIIDTPGMRELQLWGEELGVEATFADIEKLSPDCKFRDCEHTSEPGCAVQHAIEAGEIDEGRLKSYNKLKRELYRLELKDLHGQHITNRMLHGPNKKKFSN